MGRKGNKKEKENHLKQRKSNTDAALIKMLASKVPKPREVHPEIRATSHRDIISSRGRVFYNPAPFILPPGEIEKKKIIMSNA